LNFSLKQLEAFIWVADLGSFKKAADRLNTTQPNISSRISTLEDALNVTLMERDAGSVRLTSKGQELLKHAREVLQKSEALLLAADETLLYDGTLRLGVTEMIVHTWLRDFLKALKDNYPNIAVELKVDLSVNLKKELFSRSIDLAFQNGFDISTKTSLKELSKYSILTHARDTKAYSDIEEHFVSKRSVKPKLVPSSNLASCLHMTVDGLGVAALPAGMVRKELQSGELVEINYNWSPEPLSFLARYDLQKSPHYVDVAAKLANRIAFDFIDKKS